MNKKPYFRLLFLQYLDEFKEMRQRFRGSQPFKQIYQNVLLVSDREEILIELPETFEFIIHTNISPVFKEMVNKEALQETVEEGPLLELERTNINWDGIKEELHKAYLKKETLKEGAIYIALVDLLVCLLKQSFKIVDRYFPLDEYGLPSKNFLESLFNILLGAEEIVEPSPHLYKTFDPHGLLLRIENEYLKEKLRECGKDPDKEMFDDNVFFKSLSLYQILKKNPRHNIVVEPTIKARNIKDAADGLAFSMRNIETEAYSEIKDYSQQLSTVAQWADLYVDLRFNKKMSINEIRWAIKKKDPILKDVSQIRREIKKLAGLAGFIELEKSIPREQPFV